MAVYAKAHLGEILNSNESFRNGEYGEGLRQCFLEVDRLLGKEDGQKELAALKKEKPPNKAPLFKLLGDISNKGLGEDSEMMLDSIGCTANVILFAPDFKKIYVANAGDSRCVMGKAGKAVALSFDHKPDNEEEKRRIEAAGS